MVERLPYSPKRRVIPCSALVGRGDPKFGHELDPCWRSTGAAAHDRRAMPETDASNAPLKPHCAMSGQVRSQSLRCLVPMSPPRIISSEGAHGRMN